MKLATPLRAVTAFAVLAIPVAIPVLGATSAQAVESPPNNATFYLQTNGAAANIGLGDWYTAAAATAGGQDTGGAGGVHYLSFNVPCSWPAADPIDVDLYSPEINENAAVDGTYDEPNGTTNYDTTGYKLFGPNAAIGTDYTSETGTQIAAKTYAPADEGATESWQRFAELPAPVACGNYLVQSVDGVNANGNTALEDDQNGWKLRVGDDELGGTPMATGLQTPPADYDNPAGTLGDDEQLTIGQVQTSYQGDFTGGGCQNQTFYHYVDPGQSSVTFRNFDFDNPAGTTQDTVTYFDPNGVQYAGTASGSTVWNNSGTTSTDRGTGDVITNPTPGWWRIVACVTNHNQYIVEADDGAQIGTIYYPQTYTGATTPGQPPTPNLTVTKSDGQTIVDPGESLSYTITLSNTATGDTAGAATNIVATDKLPANFTFTSCTLGTTLTGTCADNSGSVVATLSSPIDAGASGTITVKGTVTSGFAAGDTLTNPVSVAYDDSLGQPYPTITASDSDTSASADLTISKSHTGNFEVGTDGSYTLTVTNDGPDRANGVQVVDTLPAGETFVSGAGAGNTNWTCNAGTVAGNGTTPVTCLYTGGSIANAGTSSITLTVAVGTAAYPSVTNSATVSSSTLDANASNNTATDPTTVTGATIGDTVFDDANDDGVQNDNSTAGTGSVTVDLLNSMGTQVATTTTSSTGAYSFAGLAGGTYSVKFVAPTGYGFSPTGKGTTSTDSNPNPATGITPTFTIANGATDNTIDAGIVPLGSISGETFTDANANGTPDSGEALGGQTVTLTGTDDLNDSVTLTTTSDATTGDYSFPDLRPGSYSVAVATPTNDTPDPVGSFGTSPRSVTLTPGEASTGQDFGFVQATGSISGTVWTDKNGDGVFNGTDTDLPGVTVTLSNGDTTTTAADGTYSFTHLVAGNYTVTVTPPTGDDISKLGTSATLPDSVVSPTTGKDAVSLTTGGSVINVDAGIISEASVSGEVYDDVDSNGVLSTGDTPLSNVTLTLSGTDDTGTAIPAGDTTKTDANGDYTFGSLRPGTYTVTETQPTAYGEGSTNVGTINGTTTGSSATDVISQIVLGAGQAGVAYNFGEQGGDVDGTVFDDETNSGTPTSGSGISGITVTAKASGGSTLTTTTDQNGQFDFPGLPAGSYTVTVTTPPSGFTLVDGTNPATSTVVAGKFAPATDFGYQNTNGAISGLVFNDLDGDGLDDNSDTPASGVTVDLLQGGTKIASTTTGGAGKYSFTDLPLGNYQVQVEPNGALFSAEEITGSNLTTDSDVSPSTGDTATLSLTSGSPTQTNVDAGLVQPNTVAGTVYFDDNRDGTDDNSETGVSGASVTLTGVNDLSNNVTVTKQTASDGSYSFTGLRPGKYQVVTTVPTGYASGAASAATPGGGTAASATKINNIALTSGTDAAPEDFGIDAGSISGEAFFDADDSGSLTAGDSGLATTITLTPSSGPAVAITSNATTGAYSFPDLPAGTYTVTATTPNGDVLDSGTSPDTVTLAAGGVTTGVNFGYRGLAADLGVTVTGPATVVTGNNATYAVSVVNNGPDASVPTITDTLPAGSTLVSDTGTGWSCTQSGQTLTCTGASIASGGTAPTLTITVTAGTTTGTVSDVATVAGSLADPTSGNNSSTATTKVITPADVALSGTVYDDVDGSGTVSAGDRPIAGVAIELTGTDDLNAAVDDKTTTAADGTYSFTGLRPGSYTVTETQPTAYSEGTTSPGSDGGAVSKNSNDVIVGITLATGDNAIDYDFGETGDTLSGTIYNDQGGDGVDNGDPGLGGETVTLTLPDNTVLSTTTANDGSYSFTGLPAGSVSVTPSGPSGDVLTQGSTPEAVTLVAGTDKTGVDFGYHSPDADVAVAVTGPTTGTAGQDQSYAVTVTNNGPDSSGDLTVTIPIPTGVTVAGTSSPGSAWSCTTVNAVLTCTASGIASGGTAPVLTVTLLDPSTGTLTVTPTASGTTTDTNTSNNSATTSTTLSAPTILPPVAHNDTGTTKSGTPVGISVLGNDTDPQNYTLTVTGSTNGAHGTVVCTATGICTYTPDKGFVGTDSFTYTVSDGHGNTSVATVTVVVTNRPPVAKPDHTSTPEGTPVVTSVLTNDSDPEGQTLTVTKHTQGKHGSVSCTATACTYIPVPGFVGTDTYTYTISDGHGGTDTTTVTVKVTDGAPVAINDTSTTTEGQPVTTSVTSNDSDPNGDPLTVIKHTNPSHGSVTCTAKDCTYTPDPGYVGMDSYTYTISDGHGKTSTATVTITVTGVLGVTTGRTPPTTSSTSGGILPTTGTPAEQELELGGWLLGIGLLLLIGGRRTRRRFS